jgi:hypothetical protein
VVAVCDAIVTVELSNSLFAAICVTWEGSRAICYGDLSYLQILMDLYVNIQDYMNAFITLETIPFLSEPLKPF